MLLWRLRYLRDTQHLAEYWLPVRAAAPGRGRNISVLLRSIARDTTQQIETSDISLNTLFDVFPIRIFNVFL